MLPAFMLSKNAVFKLPFESLIDIFIVCIFVGMPVFTDICPMPTGKFDNENIVYGYKYGTNPGDPVEPCVPIKPCDPNPPVGPVD